MAIIHPNFIPPLLIFWIQGHITETVQFSHLDCRYQFHVKGLTWMEAYNVCKDKNMTLLHLNDLNEFSTIQSLHAQVNRMISSTIESAWFGLHVASQSDGVYYFGPDCQHLPSPGHLKSTSVVSSTMCGMLNNSSGTDYMSEFIECSKSLPYVCEETQSGPVPCFLQLDMSQMTQLAPSQTYSGKDIESCGQLCFDSIRPGFILKGSDCIILTSHSTETAERDATFYTTNIIDWGSYTSIKSTIPPEEVCSMMSFATISSMSTDSMLSSAALFTSSTSETISSTSLPASSTTETISSAALSTSSTAETMSIFSLDPSSFSHVMSDTTLLTTPSLETQSGTTFSSPVTSILPSTSPCFCPCRLVRNISFTPLELQKKIEKMKSELTIPAKKTNKYQRSLTSAPDNRPSARGLGSLGIVIIGIIVTMLIAFDFPRAARSAMNIAHKAKMKSRKQRTA